MGMSETFEAFEQLNAQLDIWIDEEDYPSISQTFSISEDLNTYLEVAFEHPFCATATPNQKRMWQKLLEISSPPFQTVQNSDFFNTPFRLTPEGGYKAWSFLLWAKYLRARIQQNGTDCYYSRLDDLLIFLEKHLPLVTSVMNSKILVIYLLEMSAVGQGADHRSFSERARRVLNQSLNTRGTSIPDAAEFKTFYDLWARYNIGVGYFHEAQYRKAVLEFNLIIKDMQPIWSKGGNLRPDNTSFGRFADNRNGWKLLYAPAVFFRADIQLKLQLAYHAIKTISDLFGEELDGYRLAKSNLIYAQSFQLMGNDESWNYIKQIADFLNEDIGTPGNIASISAKPGDANANLRGRFQNLVTWECMEHVKKYIKDEKEKLKQDNCSDLKNTFGKLRSLLNECRDSSRYQEYNRRGYLEEITEYLALLVKHMDLHEIIKMECQTIFEENSDLLLVDEDTDGENWALCPCKQKGIKLSRLETNHYDTFYKNLKRFFENWKTVYATHRQEFKDRINRLEERSLENLSWRKRDLELDFIPNTHPKWCKEFCIQSNLKIKNAAAFDGLLECQGHVDQTKYELNGADYQWIMDNWDERFLTQIERNRAQLKVGGA